MFIDLLIFLKLFVIEASSINDQADQTNIGYNLPFNLIPIKKPSLYSIEADYECRGDLIERLHIFKFVQSLNKRCNEVSGENQHLNVLATFRYDNRQQLLLINATTFIDDYKGMRIMATDGIIDSGSSKCSGDRIIFVEVQLPKLGNCNIGIFQHESLLAFARIRGKCDSFCPGKVSIRYITPLINN